MALEVGLLLAVGLSSGQNRPFWLHGSLRPWFWKALASKASLSPPLPLWAWLRTLNGSPKVKGHPVQFSALVNVSVICFV